MTRNYSTPFGPIRYPFRAPIDCARQAVEGTERGLKWIAIAGKARVSPPSAAEAGKWERRVNDVLVAERSLLAGHTARLVHVGLGYAFAISAGDSRSHWYRAGPIGWRATTEDELRHPRRDEWWHPAHSPIAALTVLPWALRLWQARDDVRRLTEGLRPRAPAESYEAFDDALLDADDEALLLDWPDFPDP